MKELFFTVFSKDLILVILRLDWKIQKTCTCISLENTNLEDSLTFFSSIILD